MDFLPDIADGNLESHSLAELVASAFVSHVTGTLVVEQGRSDSRLFLRYGKPCGAQLASGESSLEEVLLQSGAVDAQTWERTRLLAQSTKVAHEEVLVGEGVLTRHQLEHFLATIQWRHVVALCLVRQGRYELRGWERPPPWTEGVALDPLRLLVEVARANEFSDRFEAIVARVGDRRVRRSHEFDGLAARLTIDEMETMAFDAVDDWMALDQFGDVFLSGDDARSLGVASLLLGLLEVEEPVESAELLAASLLSPSLPDDAFDAANASASGEIDGFDIDVDNLDIEIDGFDVEEEDKPLELNEGERSWHSAGVDPFAFAFDAGEHAAQSSKREALSDDARESTPTSPPSNLAEDDLFSGVEDLAAFLDTPEATQPIRLSDTSRNESGSDDLALAFAQESTAAEANAFEEEDIPFSFDPAGDEMALEAAMEVSEEERSGRIEISEPAGTVRTPSPSSRLDSRKRLLQRAFRNVGGDAFRRITQPIATSPDISMNADPAPEGAVLDVELDREVKERLAGRADDHFMRLGVSRNATTGQIKDAFLALAKRFHPDALSASGQLALQPAVREVFSLVKESYDALIDPAARARYLMELDAGATAKDAKSKRDPAAAEKAFGEAKKLLARKRVVDAEELLVNAVALDPKSEYLAELAWTLYQLRKDEAHDEIRSFVKRSLGTAEVHDRAYVVAAYIARVDGDDVLCEKMFRSALRVNPNNAAAASEIRLLESRSKTGWFGRRSDKSATRR